MIRLCGHVSALIDRDPIEGEAVPEDRKEFAAVCQQANINCKILERRAIENYMTERAIRKVKSDKYRALRRMEPLRDADPCWAKHENWKIAREMTEAELQQTGDLYEFLSAL